MSAAFSRHLWHSLAIVAALVFVYSSVVEKLARDWWTDENYSHGLLIPFVIAYIVWGERTEFSRRSDSQTLPAKSAIICGAISVTFALLMLWCGVAGAELFAQRLSLVLMLGGVAVYFFDFRVLRLAAVPLLLLALAIPIPAILFNKIAFPLQLFASRCAVWTMQSIGIPTLRQGNVIELMPLNAAQPKRLEVVEACSGIRSLMTLVTLAVIFAYFTRPQSETKGAHWRNKRQFFLTNYKFWRACLIVASAVPLAIAMNALRVSMTGVLARFYGTQIADGFFHTFSGWVVYVVAAILLFVFAWTLDKLFLDGGRKENLKTNKNETLMREALTVSAGE
jgi:exosortase